MMKLWLAAFATCFVGCQQNKAPAVASEIESAEARAVANETPVTMPTAPPEVSLGPFGLSMGMTKAQLDVVNGQPLEAFDGNALMYKMKRVPKPYPGMKMYAVMVGETAGLCEIRTVGEEVQSNGYGLPVIAAFDSTAADLSDVYGNAEKTDLLLPGSLWKKPEYWMMGVLKGDRVLAATWNVESGATLKNNVQMVALGVAAFSLEDARLKIQYEFSNAANCHAEVDKAKRASL